MVGIHSGERQFVGRDTHNVSIDAMKILHVAMKPSRPKRQDISESCCCPKLRTGIFGEWVETNVVDAVANGVLGGPVNLTQSQ